MSHLLFSAISVFFSSFFIVASVEEAVSLFSTFRCAAHKEDSVEANRFSLLLKSFFVVNLCNLVGALGIEECLTL